jgi:hypothetical protein
MIGKESLQLVKRSRPAFVFGTRRRAFAGQKTGPQRVGVWIFAGPQCPAHNIPRGITIPRIEGRALFACPRLQVSVNGIQAPYGRTLSLKAGAATLGRSSASRVRPMCRMAATMAPMIGAAMYSQTWVKLPVATMGPSARARPCDSDGPDSARR